MVSTLILIMINTWFVGDKDDNVVDEVCRWFAVTVLFDLSHC